MTSRTIAGALLTEIFLRGQQTLPCSLKSLSEKLGTTRAETVAALCTLERAGLLDAVRLRLTLAGLAVAVASLGAPALCSPRRSNPPALRKCGKDCGVQAKTASSGGARLSRSGAASRAA